MKNAEVASGAEGETCLSIISLMENLIRAEGEGFEPSVRVNAHFLSREAQSTALAPLRSNHICTLWVSVLGMSKHSTSLRELFLDRSCILLD